ncbi:3-keto-disaccharide hydrolase [Oceaniferula spumae]
MNANHLKKISCALVLAGVSSSLSTVLAQETKKKKYDTPKQPWSEYTVHDMTRPHPEKVAGKTAVTTKAPEGAIVLFDGKNTDAFTKNWKVQDGILIASPGDIRTKQSFGSIQLHVEWRIPAGRKVSGQGGGNSGIFLMDRYEIQVQESHTNVTYADGQAGAIYGQTPPKVNPSAPQGEWQSFDITFQAPVYGEDGVMKSAHVTVVHNGVKIHDQQVIYGPTTHKKVAKYPKTHPEKAPLRIQWHGDPIEFRNIWLTELKK